MSYSGIKDQGPVVQSVVSLMSSLRVISLTVLADSMHNIPIFFAEKMWVAFVLQKLLRFFSKKFQHICLSLDVNFNESLTKDVVSFEQLSPDQPVPLQSHKGLCLLLKEWLDQHMFSKKMRKNNNTTMPYQELCCDSDHRSDQNPHHISYDTHLYSLQDLDILCSRHADTDQSMSVFKTCRYWSKYVCVQDVQIPIILCQCKGVCLASTRRKFLYLKNICGNCCPIANIGL